MASARRSRSTEREEPSAMEGRKRKALESGRDAPAGKSPRTGGAYIPPFKLAKMMKEVGSDKQSESYQRLAWDALRKSINGLVNKVSPASFSLLIWARPWLSC